MIDGAPVTADPVRRESSSGLDLSQVKRPDWAFRRLLGAGDAVAVTVALTATVELAGRSGHGGQLLWGLAAVPLMIVLLKVYGLYDRDVKRISYSTSDDLPHLFHAAVLGSLLLWLYSRATPMNALRFAEVLLFGVATIVLVTGSRLLLRANATRIFGLEPALLIGSPQVARAFVRKLAGHPEYRLELVGALSDGTDAGDAELPVLGGLADLDEVAAAHNVTRVVFVASEIHERELEVLLRHCRSLALKVSLLPRLSDVLGSAVGIDDVEGVTVLGLSPPWLPRSSRAVKRIMDLVISLVLLVVLSPVLLLLALAIRLDSGGPVLFSQERVGKADRRFRLYKFRTMVTSAEQQRAELLALSTDPNWLKLERDPRVTRLGRWMRRLSLDELPQLWNVLRGQMSMVGPRPLIPEEDQLVQGWARRRLDLTPGMTGYWQVLGRTRIPFEEMVKLDYLYVMNWSLWEDVRLMLKTVPALIRGRGAT